LADKPSGGNSEGGFGDPGHDLGWALNDAYSASSVSLLMARPGWALTA
jgi:hypothetical protein